MFAISCSSVTLSLPASRWRGDDVRADSKFKSLRSLTQSFKEMIQLEVRIFFSIKRCTFKIVSVHSWDARAVTRLPSPPLAAGTQTEDWPSAWLLHWNTIWTRSRATSEKERSVKKGVLCLRFPNRKPFVLLWMKLSALSPAFWVQPAGRLHHPLPLGTADPLMKCICRSRIAIGQKSPTSRWLTNPCAARLPVGVQITFRHDYSTSAFRNMRRNNVCAYFWVCLPGSA